MSRRGLGAVYDLFGNGRTAVKFTMGKYLEAAVNGNGNYSGLLPSARIATSVTRTWNDANRDYNPDCNLQNPLGERRVRSDLESQLRQERLQPFV